MSINLSMRGKDHYLHVMCSGEFEPELFLDACKKALSFACEEKMAAVLIDGTGLTGEIFTTMERYEIGKKFAEFQRSLSRTICAAVVGNEPLIDPFRFGETVAINRGALGKVFTDIEEAARWLERWHQERFEC